MVGAASLLLQLLKQKNLHVHLARVELHHLTHGEARSANSTHPHVHKDSHWLFPPPVFSASQGGRMPTCASFETREASQCIFSTPCSCRVTGQCNTLGDESSPPSYAYMISVINKGESMPSPSPREQNQSCFLGSWLSTDVWKLSP